MLQRSEQNVLGVSHSAAIIDLTQRARPAAPRRDESRQLAANDAGVFPEEGPVADAGLEVRDMTVLFADIRGFTGLAEALKDQPLRVAQLAKTVLGALAEIVVAHGGVVDKFLGDGIMAYWGADRRHARRAVAAAEAMLVAVDRLNNSLDLSLAGGGSLSPIRIGIGVNSGECVVGDLGSDRHASHSVMGDTVNVASRLVGMTKDYGVCMLIGEGTAERLPPSPRCRELDHVAVRGRLEAQGLFTMAPFTAANEA